MLSNISKNHWFIPKYLEFDFKTLRGGLIREPVTTEVVYPFNYSLKNLILFYKNRGY